MASLPFVLGALVLFNPGAEAPPSAPAPRILRSNVERLTIRDGEARGPIDWNLAPEVDPDVFEAELVDGRAHDVVFESDVESIRFRVEEGKSYDFVVRWNGKDCRTRIVGTRHVPAAVFDERYRSEHRGRTIVEVPEAYELVNIALAMTPTGIADRDLVYHDSDYYARMRAWFDPHRNQPVLAALDRALAANPGLYFPLKMNGYAFVFDASGKLARSPVFDRSGFAGDRSNLLLPYLDGLRELAVAADFRRFYRENASTYADQIAFFRDQADVPGMISWLDRNFPRAAGYDCRKLIFSPLVAYNQSATWFESGGFRELQAHINFPYPADLARSRAQDLSPAAATLFRGNIAFTELNHGYLNPETDRHGARAARAVANRARWVEPSRPADYYRGIATFNEYMNWGLVCLRYVDVAPPAERDGMIARVERMMVERRGFPRFHEFDRRLIELYRNRAPGETVADLFPKILDWFENQDPADEPAPATPPPAASTGSR
jgi:hypothetical protein